MSIVVNVRCIWEIKYKLFISFHCLLATCLLMAHVLKFSPWNLSVHTVSWCVK